MKRQRRWQFEKIEMWVIMLALENFPAKQVWQWDMAQWVYFYERINRGGAK